MIYKTGGLTPWLCQYFFFRIWKREIIFQSQSTQNVIYDNSGKVIEINDNNGLILSSNTYNSSNKLTKHEFNEYDNGILYFKEIDNLTYNSDNKISNIEHISFSYNPKRIHQMNPHQPR